MNKNIFEKYPENLQSEYNASILILKNLFNEEEINEWNDEIKIITDSGVRSWEVII